ncbi:MAG: Asp-tRNA(Asn)/Glu-tRNA(Gln) amidotransferase subunit GatB, partial [Gammaproteobacteria bacterium]|nr:Asp-tRNA(Asn)/Glu-tRNA(Gln) amidotransferase subunit GatB [Gammaproteobacteria bacterium]
MTSAWETVIGLEVHVQLKTKSKIFSGASTAYGAEPNTQACAVDLGLPGVLPVLNREAVRMAVMFGLAIGAKINRRSVFARKNYFYPDLPKGYQISQFELPVVEGGSVTIAVGEGETKSIGVTRAHLEEDAGKSIHDVVDGSTAIDLNRAGTPLLEIVSEPDMRSAAEAVAYLRKIHALVTHLGICDGNMQEGSFRCDANVSVRPRGESTLGTRTELKNINSFRFVERAILHEVDRHIDVIESGAKIVQQTRLYDANRNETRPMRDKEEANDYRYFPDPDLAPLEIEQSFIDATLASLPELPEAKSARFQQIYELSEYDANLLTATPALAEYYEHTVAASGGHAKLCANWVSGELLAAINRHSIELTAVPLSAERLGHLVARVADDTISGKAAKDVFEAMWSNDDSADETIDALGLRQISD